MRINQGSYLSGLLATDPNVDPRASGPAIPDGTQLPVDPNSAINDPKQYETAPDDQPKTDGSEPDQTPAVDPAKKEDTPAVGADTKKATKADPMAIGSFVGSNYFQPYDETKFQSKEDPKYDVLRALSFFDPKQGITDDVLAKLNALGLGTFARKTKSDGSTSKDYLTLTNADPRWNGMLGMDAISSEGGPDAKWMVGGEFAGQGSGGGDMGTTGANMANGDMSAGQSPEQTTNVSDNLKSLLQKYYSGAAPNPFMRINQGLNIHGDPYGHQ